MVKLTGDYNWVGGAAGSFSNGDNWDAVPVFSTGKVPGRSALAAISNDATISGNGSVGQLNIEDGATNTAVTFTGAITTQGLYLDQGASITVTSSQGKFVCATGIIDGAVTVSAGASLTARNVNPNDLTITGASKVITREGAGGGTTIIEGAGTSLTAGYFSASSLTLADSAVVTDHGMADIEGGAITISSGAKLNAASDLTLGTATLASKASVSTGGNLLAYVTGTSLTVESGAKLSAAAAFFNDTAMVSGVGSALSIKGLATIGDYATTRLTVAAGGRLTAGSADLGSPVNNTLIVTGKGSTARITGALDVGRAGLGALFAQAAGAVEAGSLVVGDKAGTSSSSVGTVTVRGTGGALTVLGTTTLGDSGTGNLTVASGGRLTADGAWQAGAAAGSMSTALISGTGSSLIYKTVLGVGGSGKATMNIEAGGIVAAAAGTGAIAIAERAGSTGSVLVEGAGSKLEGASLAIGGTMAADGGKGFLTVDGGGLVSASSVRVWDGATVRLAGGRLATKTMALSAGALITGIGTVAGAIANAGAVTGTGSGTLILTGAIANTGTLAAINGNLTVDGAVSGAGVVHIDAGKADFAAAFGEDVTFTGTAGVLELGRSRSYGGTISGFSTSGSTSLDLRDIAFTGNTTGVYTGTATSGVLKVTEGANVATIALKGNYLSSTFTLSAAPGGGTLVVDHTKTAMHAHVVDPAPAHRFVAAMAGFAAPAGASAAVAEIWNSAPRMLAMPRAQMA